MQIAIADLKGRVNLWCDVNNINEDGSIDFYVINGAWYGTYHDGQVYVEATNKLLPGKLVWVGDCNGNYNEVMPWIQEHIDSPGYVMIQPDQYIAPARIVDDYKDEWDDDIPF